MINAFQRFLETYLRPYQLRLIEDPSPRIICLKARQIGFSEAVIILAIMEATKHEHHDVFLTSLSMREAKELLRRAGKWIRVFSKFFPAFASCNISATKIEFPNGSRILALPALAVRSRSGTIVLDEFALQKRCREIWSAISPAAESSSNLRIIIVSTPFGEEGVYADIWNDNGRQYGEWSRHKVDVYQAAKEGFPVDPEEIRARTPNDVFDQEWLCKFVTDSDQYFSNGLILDATIDDERLPDDVAGHDLFAGIDFAEAADSTVVSRLLRKALGDDNFNRILDYPEIIKPAGERRRLTDQLPDIEAHLDAHPYMGIGCDGAGIGRNISEDIEAAYEQVKVWQGANWAGMAPIVQQMKTDMETGALRLAASQDLARAFSRVQKSTRSNKTIKFDAVRDKHGHADEFYASVMAYDVSSLPVPDDSWEVAEAPNVIPTMF